MQNLKSYKPRSISRTLSAGLIITLIVVAGLSLGVDFILSSRKAEAELETRAEEYISALTDALSVPLWNYDETTISTICASYAQNEFVAKLLLEDQTGAVLFKKEEIDQRLVVSKSRDIVYENNPLGSIYIALGSGYYTAVNRQLFQSFSLTIAIMIGALLVMTGVLLRQFLKKPMSRFIQMVDTYAAGESDAFKQGIPYEEFRPLVNVLDKMGEKIASHMKSIRKLNEDLERRVEERTVELRASEEKSRLLLESVGEGIFGVDLEGKVAFINPAANRMLDYGPEELIGHDVHNKIHHSHADGSAYPKTKCPMYLTHADGKDYRIVDEVLWRKDGSSFPVEYTSMPIKKKEQVVGAVVTFMDITDRKQAEQAIRESQSKYRDLVENANCIIFQMDTKGNITFFNRFAQEFFGYSEAEILGRNIVGTITPATDSSGSDLEIMIKDLVKHPEKYADNENENIRCNGELAWVAWTNRAIYDDDNRLSEILCIGIDRTEQKKMEDKLRHNLEELERFNKLAIGRELKMIQLKEEINELMIQSGKVEKYKIVG